MKRSTSLPCALCGLCGTVDLSGDRTGRACLFYGVYIPGDDLSNPAADIRRQCLKDGDNFVWRVRGASPLEHFHVLKERLDWSQSRKASRVNMNVAVASLCVAVISLLVSFGVALG